MQPKYPYEPWSVTESGFSPENLRENESVFALGNGFIGMRGNLEENAAAGAETIQGTFLNGVFDAEPISYGETAYGYAKNHETICNVMDAKSLYLSADGEALSLGVSRVEGHTRRLDLRAGVLSRDFLWKTASGAKLEIACKRLVSLTRQNLAAMQVKVKCLSGQAALSIRSELRPARITEGDPNDPRSAAGKDRALKTTVLEGGENTLAMRQETKRTGYVIHCAVHHRWAQGSGVLREEDAAVWTGTAAIRAGEELRFEKAVCYIAGRGAGDMEAENARATAMSEGAPAFETLAAEQRAYLDRFWEGAGISIEGDDALLQGLRFNLFHLLQSAGRDGRRNIAAKGLTGEGYEGHAFWDTEAYILPVFQHTEPEVARRLLEYRYAILPQARERARVMGHKKGALFAWRTIDGEECSAYFPAGTAQYHIDGDVAHAVWEYWFVTGDLEFLAKYGAEILVEAARLYYDLGFFSAAKGGRFVLNCVTGPDEYNVMVDNNVYTNCVAEETFRHAAEVTRLLERSCPEDYLRLCEALSYTPEEGNLWEAAADAMYYPPAQDGVYPQDDGFLSLKPWPLESIPPEQRPLLLHHHPLVIYRHMICKQADLILAMTTFGERYTLEEKRRNFEFYDSVTTHDSSLSTAVFSILASEIGKADTAYDYFLSSARLDLDDTHHNTKDGLHMANMAGTWNCIAKGFGGMRYRNDTLFFAPVCPAQWKGYSFRVCFRGRIVEVCVTRDGARYALIKGAPLAIYERDRRIPLDAAP